MEAPTPDTLVDSLGASFQRRERINSTLSVNIERGLAHSTRSSEDRYHVSLRSAFSGRGLLTRRTLEVPAHDLDLLEELLVPSSNDAYKLRVVQYAPRYRLAFSLLNEDASVGGGLMGWDVEAAIRRRSFPFPFPAPRLSDHREKITSSRRLIN